MGGLDARRVTPASVRSALEAHAAVAPASLPDGWERFIDDEGAILRLVLRGPAETAARTVVCAELRLTPRSLRDATTLLKTLREQGWQSGPVTRVVLEPVLAGHPAAATVAPRAGAASAGETMRRRRRAGVVRGVRRHGRLPPLRRARLPRAMLDRLPESATSSPVVA